MRNRSRLLVKALALGVILNFTPEGRTATYGDKVDTLKIAGLSETVEIIKDRWGISHIYAQNQPDLFFAQGWNAARDRLFQFEMWRRRALGLLAEIQGEKALQHDIGARLLKLRKPIEQEMAHYHEDGREIITSFVAGINAYIELTRQNPDLLPIEFGLLGIQPGEWTPEIVVSRHNGLFFGARAEVATAQLVHKLGADKVREINNYHHGQPDLEVKPGLDLSLITQDVLEIYNASRFPPPFTPEDIAQAEHRGKSPKTGALFNQEIQGRLAQGEPENARDYFLKLFGDVNEVVNTIGSNNWVLSGEKTFSGYPIMANDPHRSLQVPSLRYWAHLNAPGWNAIGGGEPALPGLSIGHNEHGAWGLTIFLIDQEDLYTYDTNPENPNQYKYQGRWQDMEMIEESIPVKGQEPKTVQLKYTRHGPVLYEDAENSKAYALRAAWLEIGTAPYLASLRMDQAATFEEFREACSFSGTPPENMVWADKNGNIGWQAVGFTPVRNDWQGVLPVPGDGRFEWTGFLPVKSLPNVYNPEKGHFATANQNNVPLDYPYHIGFNWSDPFRFHRIEEVLGSGRKLTLSDNMLLQHDELSLVARAIVPLLKNLKSDDRRVAEAMRMLLDWDFVLDANSVEAGIYAAWEKKLAQNVIALRISLEDAALFGGVSRVRLIEWLVAPDGAFGKNPVAARDELLLNSLSQALEKLTNKLGADMRRWQYGQAKYHHSKIQHMLSGAVTEAMKEKLNVGPLPRGGYGYTVNNTSNSDNQRSGGTFRIIADTGNWDNSVGTNSPGQSGDPNSPHYGDLFKLWAEGRYFPAFYSRPKVESVAQHVTHLQPEK